MHIFIGKTRFSAKRLYTGPSNRKDISVGIKIGSLDCK
jgi:hypothetical protein